MVRPIRRMLLLVAAATLGCRDAAREPLAVPSAPIAPTNAATAEPLRVLLISDVDIPGTLALESALRDAVYAVTRRPGPEYTWTGADPAPDGFDAIVHLDGATYYASLSAAAQTALVNFVNGGGHYVTDMYTQYEVRTTATQPLMTDLALHQWGGGAAADNCAGGNITYTMVPTRANHPVMAGMPASFTFNADGHDAGPLVTFATRPAVVLMQAPHGGPAVTARHVGLGCVTNFSFAANQGQAVGFTLQDPNVQRLYVNAAAWDCTADSDPPNITLVVSPTTLWPPNHQMVLVAKGIIAIDDVDGAPQFDVTVSAVEGNVSIGKEKNNPDWNIVKNLDGSVDVWVRAERVNTKAGRVYTISVTASDANGNAATRTGTVSVPKDSK